MTLLNLWSTGMSQFSVDHCERENVSVLPTVVEDLMAGTLSRKEAW